MVRSIRHEKWLEPGQSLTIDMELDNIGVAPPYRAYKPVIEIRSAGGRSAKQVLTHQETDWNILNWLPGRHLQSTSLMIPPETKPGRYIIYFALLDPYNGQPVIRLAVDGRDAQNWYSWSSLEIVDKGTLEKTLQRQE